MGSLFSTGFWHHSLEVILVHLWALAKVVIFFLIVRFLGYRVINRVIKSLISRETGEESKAAHGRLKTLGGLIRSIIFYVLIFISGVMTLKVFNVDPTPVLTAAGVAGLAIGFGAQKLVKDILSGFFILLENQYSIGDYITIGPVTGTVVELGMRITKLRDDVGKLVIIPNGDVSQVTNHSRGPLQAIVDISVDPRTEPAKLRAVIDAAGLELAKNVEGILTPPKADGIIGLDALKMTIRVAGEVKTGRQWAVQTALREAIREKLMEAGIPLAYESVVYPWKSS